MKKFLFALLMFTGLAAVAPKAEAGQYARVWNGCGYVYVPKTTFYGYPCEPRPRVSYCPPVQRTYYSAPVRSYGYCPPVRCYSGGPRISFSFGF